jgi:adenosine deaminase
MVTVEDFINCPKVDAHNHLNLGMKYSSYVPWAGFYIPDFPRKLKGLDDMHANIIAPYTRPRIKTAKDVEDVLTLSIKDAIADGVKVLEGSIDIQFVHHLGSTENLCELISKLVKKYSDKILVLPELGMGKTFGMEKIQKWAPELLESKVFKSIDLYGPEVEDGIEDFKNIYQLASKLGLKKKAHIGEFSNADSVKRFVEFFELDEVQHGIGASSSIDVMKFLRDNKIRCNMCPESNVMLGAVESYEKHPIRKMLDFGIDCTINTDDLLLFNKTNSEQCVELVKANLFTCDELKKLISDQVAQYKLA